MIRISHACAVQAKTFTICYERIDGRYKHVPEPPKQSMRESLRAIASGRASVVEKKQEIDLATLERPPCPHCGSKGWIICGNCETHVCMALSTQDIFKCRKSCGAYGLTSPAMTCDAVGGPSGQAAIGGPEVRRLK